MINTEERTLIASPCVAVLNSLNLILAHLVTRFVCNTKVIVDASSNPPVSHVKIAVTQKLETNHHINKRKLTVTPSINQMVIR